MINEELRIKIDEYCKNQEKCKECIFYDAISKGFLCGSSSTHRLKDLTAVNIFKKEILGEENKINDEELDLALLFDKWLINSYGVDFDTYVEIYSNNLEARKEVDKQTELVDFADPEKEK